MGVWGYGLYSNDITNDVKEQYLALLRQYNDDFIAYDKTLKSFSEYFGTDEECLVWYALAETQWSYGRLMPEIKNRALTLIANNQAPDEMKEDDSFYRMWTKTLKKLYNKLSSPIPQRKTLGAVREIITNPWNIGDVYAYRFHTKHAAEYGMNDKYIAIQKVGDAAWYRQEICTRVQIFNKLFNAPMSLDDLTDAPILPIDYPERLINVSNAHIITFPLNLTGVMMSIKKKDYKDSNFIFIGNMPDIHNSLQIDKSICDIEWNENGFERYVCYLFDAWKNMNNIV